LGQISSVQDAVFCKSILNEFAVKTKTTWPSYSLVSLTKPLTLFAATVVFDGNRYTGESARNKKDAEQNAARAVIKSILGILCYLDLDLRPGTIEPVCLVIIYITSNSI
jgi:dsRNA-specific ribonuclease